MAEERDPPTVGSLLEPALLDTSVWARYLRHRGPEGLKNAVRDVLEQGRAATCWVVKSELLVGARDLPAFELLHEALRGVPDIPITAARWRETAELGRRLRKQGLPIPLPDLLIAQCAISSGRVLWHADAGYERIRQHTSLRTLNWLDTN